MSGKNVSSKNISSKIANGKGRAIFGGVMRGIGHVGKKPVRFKYEIYVDRLHGLRNGRYKVRFSRGTKGVETNVKAMDDAESNTMVIFEQKTLGMYTTLYRDDRSKHFDTKDFKLSLIEVRNDGGKRTDRLAGATVLNLGDYAGVPTRSTDKTLKLGAGVTASVKITSTFVMDGADRLEDDALSESSLSGDSFGEDEDEFEASGEDSGNLGVSLGSQELAPAEDPRTPGSLHSDRVESVTSTERRESRLEVELAGENDRLRRDLEEKDREIQKYGALVRSVSSKNMETQLEAEAKLEELQLLNENLNAELDRSRAELSAAQAAKAEQTSSSSRSTNTDALESIHIEKIAALEANVKTLQDEKRATRSKIKAHEHHQERLKATYKNLSDMYNKLRVDYANLAKKYKSAKVKAVSSQTSTLQAVAQELEREKVRRERDDVVDELNRLRGEQFGEIEAAKRERAEAAIELDMLRKSLDVLEESEISLRQVIAERDIKSRELDTLNMTVAAEVDKVKQEKLTIERDLASTAAKKAELELGVSKANSKISELENALEESTSREQTAVQDLDVLQTSTKSTTRAKDDEIGGLTTERNKLLNELVVASKKNKELENSSQDRASLINELENLRRNMDDDKRRHERVENETKLLLDESSNEMKQVSEELETALLKMELAEKSYGQEINGLQVDLDESHQKIASMIAEHTAALESVEQEKDSAIKRLSDLEKENESANTNFSSRIEKAGRDLEDVRSRNARDLGAMKDTHATVLSGMEKEFRDKYGRVCTERDSLQKNLFEISEQLDNARTDLEVARDSMKSDVQSARVELDAAIQEIDRLSKTSIELEEKNETLESNVLQLEQAKTELLENLHSSEKQLNSIRDDFKKKLASKESELDEQLVVQEKLEKEIRSTHEGNRKELESLEIQLNRSVEEAKAARTKLESQLEFANREKEESARELALVQSQNYEERTQALSSEVSKAREERDAKVMALTSLQEERNSIEVSIREKEGAMTRLENELMVQEKRLEESLAKNKLLVQEMKNEHQNALLDEESRRNKMALELRTVKEQLAVSEGQVKEYTSKGYDGQITKLKSDLDIANEEKKSITLELDQTRQLLAKRTTAAESEKTRANRDVNALRDKVLETESELESALNKLHTANEENELAIAKLKMEKQTLTDNMFSMEKDIESRAVDVSKLSELKDHASKIEYELKIGHTQKEQLAKSLADEQNRLAELQAESSTIEEELRKVKRDSIAEIKRASAERDDAVILLQKTRTAAKGTNADVGRLKTEILENEKKLKQANGDVARMKEERDKVLKEMDDLQNSFSNQKGVADAATDKKGRNTDAQLRAAYSRERTLQTRITSLIEENKVLKDGIKKGDSFDSVLHDLVQVKVALAIAEEDKLLLQDELRKFRGSDVAV